MTNQVNSFSCACLSHQGRLCVSEQELYFFSTSYRVDFSWMEVAQVEVVTKHFQGKPANMLSIRTLSQPAPLLFHSFRDIHSAEQQLQKYWALSRRRKFDIDTQISTTVNDNVRDGERGVSDELVVSESSDHEVVSREDQQFWTPRRVFGVICVVVVSAFAVAPAADIQKKQPSRWFLEFEPIAKEQSLVRRLWHTSVLLIAGAILVFMFAATRKINA